MSLTYQQARKEMFAFVDAAWAGKSGAIVGGADPELRYQGFELPEKPKADEFWAFLQATTVTSRQAGFQEAGDAPDGVVFATYGFLTMTIFAPMGSQKKYARGELLAELGQCMFMATSTPGQVWFRNPRINELKNDGTWYRWNVLADYQFDQVKERMSS